MDFLAWTATDDLDFTDAKWLFFLFPKHGPQQIHDGECWQFWYENLTTHGMLSGEEDKVDCLVGRHPKSGHALVGQRERLAAVSFVFEEFQNAATTPEHITIPRTNEDAFIFARVAVCLYE